ncbi:MAG: hypothetical protein FWD52_04125 [Candidatus Bathyarchaeota archaeon]|nr:hypothetical protein [Candidatus Termiticorpusculum sp.]
MSIIMSFGVKRKIIGVVIIVVIFIFLGSLLVFDRPQDPDLIAYKVQTNQVFEDAKIEFERLRGVTLPSDITLSVYTKQQAIDKWGKPASNLDIENILRQENIYKSLFLMTENESLSNASTEWVASWTAVTVNNEIYVIYENFWPWDIPNAKAILIHELTHVWQPAIPSPTNYDSDQAQNALLEGDASYMANYYYSTEYNKNISNSSNSKISYNTSLPAFLYLPKWDGISPNVPNAVYNLNWFPYIQGETFVSAIVDNYGWSRLNLCYTTPAYTPSTTEQILHPNKYFTGETAKPPLAPTPSDDSWTIIPSRYGYPSDTYGEYFIYIMLNQWLDDNQAQKAATGWGGDNFTYYEKDTDFLFTWNINWDSIKDASEFNQAFTDMLKLTQATPNGNNQWLTNNNRYLTLFWNPNTATTLIICSTNQTATNHAFFTQ